MTRRITCYVVFITLIWGAHTQRRGEEFRDNKFKSNMTRNDFSNLLSSLIKLNEQRVSVLQRLYKLEDYGVLSEVLRTGDRKPENVDGKPNNLFLIVMSKNKTDPSRRNIDFEVVDTVTSLDDGSKKVHPKLNYVLDPAGYISQNAHKENSIEKMFGNIPKVHRPKKTLLIDSGSEKNTTTKKPLKHHKPAQRTEVSVDTNTLRDEKTVLKARKEKSNVNKKSKFEIVRNHRSTNPNKKLRDFDNKNDSPIGYHDSPHYPEIFVTKTVKIEDTISNDTHQYKDRGDENDYSSTSSEEYVDNTAHRQGIKGNGEISTKNSKDSNKHTIAKTAIKSTTTKSILRMMSTVNDHKNSEEKEDENNYGSSFSKEYVENGPNHKYTKIDSDVSSNYVHGDNNRKPKKSTHSPEKRIQSGEQPKLNQSISLFNNRDNKYTIIMAELKTTTVNSTNPQDTKTDNDNSTKRSKVYQMKPILDNYSNKYTTTKTDIKPTNKNELPVINSVVTDKTDTLSNNNQEDKLLTVNKDVEDENYYGSPFSKEYDEKDPSGQNTKIDDFNPKINVQDKQPPNLNRSKSILEQDTTFSTINTEPTTATTINDIKIVSTVNIDKASEDNLSINNPNINVDLKDTKIKNEHSSKEIGQSNKFPSLFSQNTSGSDISEATQDLSSKNYNDYDYSSDVGNDTNKGNPGIARDVPGGDDYGDEQPENNTYPGNVRVSEDVNIKTTPPMKTDSPLHLQNVTENSNKEKSKAIKELRIENNTNVKHKKHKDHHGKESSNNGADFIIDKKKGDEFSIIVTHLGKEKPEEIKQPDNLRVNSKEFNQPDGKPIARKAFQKCLNKKAEKLCCKSCVKAYKNVCTRLKCTSKAKKALKKECKKSCEKTFKSSSSKYSDEDSDYSYSDYSDSDYS